MNKDFEQLEEIDFDDMIEIMNRPVMSEETIKALKEKMTEKEFNDLINTIENLDNEII